MQSVGDVLNFVIILKLISWQVMKNSIGCSLSNRMFKSHLCRQINSIDKCFLIFRFSGETSELKAYHWGLGVDKAVREDWGGEDVEGASSIRY
jgi:hypothetical protein